MNTIDAEQEAALLAALPQIPRLGWTMAALRAGAGDEAAHLFPNGAPELAAAFTALADRWMAEDAAAADMTGLRTPGRVRAVIALRLARLQPHRDAVRLAAGLFALPHMARWATRAASATIDAIWRAAGEPLEDSSRHTKRPILGVVYFTTLMIWLRDDSPGNASTLAFLDRRLADVGRIGKFRARLGIHFPRRAS